MRHSNPQKPAFHDYDVRILTVCHEIVLCLRPSDTLQYSATLNRCCRHFCPLPDHAVWKFRMRNIQLPVSVKCNNRYTTPWGAGSSDQWEDPDTGSPSRG